jgi:hypothetical protein
MTLKELNSWNTVSFISGDKDSLKAATARRGGLMMRMASGTLDLSSL